MHRIHLQTSWSFLLNWRIFQTLLIFIVCNGIATAETELKPDKTSYWYSHDYPNPQHEPERCGRPPDHKSWLCDPDNFISEEDAMKLDELMNSVHTQTRCNCYSCIPNHQGYLVMVALMEGMYREPNNGNDSMQELFSDSNKFATELMDHWDQDSGCRASILILFSKNDNVLYTKRQKQVGLILNTTMVSKVNRYVSSSFSYNEGIAKGLTKMITFYKDILLRRFKDPGYTPPRVHDQTQYSQTHKPSKSKASSRHQKFNSLTSTFAQISLCSFLLTSLNIFFI